jgi:hypothetical protein
MIGRGAPQSLALGQLGSRFINDTTARTGLSVGRIQCIAAATFTTLTSGNGPDGTALMAGTLSGISLSAGMEIQGYFTAITLAGGSIIAYNV